APVHPTRLLRVNYLRCQACRDLSHHRLHSVNRPQYPLPARLPDCLHSSFLSHLVSSKALEAPETLSAVAMKLHTHSIKLSSRWRQTLHADEKLMILKCLNCNSTIHHGRYACSAIGTTVDPTNACPRFSCPKFAV